MKLIKDLGMILPKETKQKVRFGIYECPKCFEHFETRTAHVKNGNSTQCKKCGNIAGSIKRTSHGDSYKRLHRTWRQMKQRCGNPKNKDFHHYGEKGIEIEFISYEEFALWARSNGYTDKMTIERNDNSLGYSSKNCIWIPAIEQQKNTSQCIKNRFTQNQIHDIKKRINSKKISQTQISKELGISRPTITKIIKGFYDEQN